jgi:hypothetical protein
LHDSAVATKPATTGTPLVKRLGAVEMEVQNIARQMHAIQRRTTLK